MVIISEKVMVKCYFTTIIKEDIYLDIVFGLRRVTTCSYCPETLSTVDAMECRDAHEVMQQKIYACETDYTKAYLLALILRHW